MTVGDKCKVSVLVRLTLAGKLWFPSLDLEIEMNLQITGIDLDAETYVYTLYLLVFSFLCRRQEGLE